LAKESGLKEGIVSGYLDNVHLYTNHLEAVKKQISRIPYDYPKIETSNFKSIFDWSYQDTILNDYIHHDPIRAKVAI